MTLSKGGARAAASLNRRRHDPQPERAACRPAAAPNQAGGAASEVAGAHGACEKVCKERVRRVRLATCSPYILGGKRKGSPIHGNLFSAGFKSWRDWELMGARRREKLHPPRAPAMDAPIYGSVVHASS